MPCRPKLPTGEKKPTKFQAPIFYPTADPEQLQRLLGQAFGSVQDDLAGLHARVDTPPLTTPVTAVSGTVMAKAGDVLRLMPGPAGIQVLLPAARATNKGQDVSIIVQGSTGTVTVRAVEGKVQGVASVTLTGDGLRVFRSDGGDGTATGAGAWWIVGRNSADSSAQLAAISAGTQFGSTGTIAFGNGSGVTFGMAGSSLITASVVPQIGLLSHLGGNSVSGATRLAFSNASGITWSLSTAAGAATLLASADVSAIKSLSLVTYASGLSSSVSAATDSVLSGQTAFLQLAGTEVSLYSRANVLWRASGQSLVGVAPVLIDGPTGGPISAQNLSFSNANGVTFGLTNSVVPTLGRFVQVTASIATSLTNINVSAGTTSNNLSAITFNNSNGISFGLNGSVVTANYGRELSLVSHGGGNSMSAVSRLVFTSQGNINWSFVTAASAVTVIPLATAVGVGAGSQFANSGQVTFSDSNGITFGMSGFNQVTASYARELGLVSHVGGNVVSSVTRLAFSNASNVTWSLSTAANAVTVLASVDAGGGGGIGGIAMSGSTQTSGTVNFARDGGLDAAGGSASVRNVQFAFNTGASSTNVGATALIRIDANANVTDTGGLAVTKFVLSNSNGVVLGTSSTTNVDGRYGIITASVNYSAIAPSLNWYLNGGIGGSIALNNLAGLTGSMWLTPFVGTMPGNITANTFEILMRGVAFTSTQSTASYSWAVRCGVYTLANSTQLSLVNSFLASSSATTESFASRNSLIAGDRWLTVGTARWSSNPVFSAGVNYWIGMVNQTAGAVNIFSGIYEMPYVQPTGGGYSGNLGVAHAGSSQFGIVPFIGGVNTTGVPTTIGTAGLVNYSNFNLAPVFAIRQDVGRIA